MFILTPLTLAQRLHAELEPLAPIGELRAIARELQRLSANDRRDLVQSYNEVGLPTNLRPCTACTADECHVCWGKSL